MASATFKNNRHWESIHPITLINPRTQKSINIEAKVDTGAIYTMVGTRYAAQLGITNLRTGKPVEVVSMGKPTNATAYYSHPLLLKIGSLQPIPVNVVFGPERIASTGPLTFLGWTGGLNQFILDVAWDHIKYTEIPVGV